MKDESRRHPSRLSLRSWAKKRTPLLLRALTTTKQTEHAQKGDENRTARAPPKRFDHESGSSSSTACALPSPLNALRSSAHAHASFVSDDNSRTGSTELVTSRGRRRSTDQQPQDFDVYLACTYDQSQASFFGKLPQEIRDMIYQELWRDSGTAQHVIRTPMGYAHTRCLIDLSREPGGGGEGFYELWEAMWMVPDARGSGPLWYKREMSSWGEHWKCEEAKEEKEIWKSVAVAYEGTLHGLEVDTWTAFLPMMLTCRRMYDQCAASLYRSVTFTINDVTLAKRLLGIRYTGTTGHHPFRRVSLSFKRHIHERPSFKDWINSWTAVLRLLDTPDFASAYLWLDSDIERERHWLSVSANVLGRIPETMMHKVAVNLPPDGYRDRDPNAGWTSACSLHSMSCSTPTLPHNGGSD